MMIYSPRTLKKLCKIFVAVCCIIHCFSFVTNAQTLFSEGFEDEPLPAGWSTQSYTAGGNTWGQYWYDWNTGHYSVACFPNVTNASSWLFTKPLNLEAGKFYELSGYYKIAFGARFMVTLGTNTGFQSQPQAIRADYVRGYFAPVKDTIVCEQTGTYYLGFYNYSATGSDCGTLIDDISLTEMNMTSCTTVAAGTISTVSSICANSNFTITNANATINTPGTRYAWQRSTDGSSWTNITNGYNYQPSIQVSQTVPTWYRFTDTCTASSASGISNQVFVNNSSYLSCYCTPTITNCFSATSFTNIKILGSAVNNTSTCSTNGYGDFTAVGNASVYRNQNIYIQHTVNNPYNYPYQVGIWADVNHNGVFEENEFSMNGPFTGTSGTSQFLVPATALTGETRLRIKSRVFGNILFSEACTGGGQSGEIEDYKITIGDIANCSGAVAAGTISAPAQLCPNNSFSLTATGTTIYQGQVRYAWQKSTDNISWTNINNTAYLVNPLTVAENSSAYYRLTDTCLASGQNAISNTVSVIASNIFTCYCAPGVSTCTTFGIDSLSLNTIHNGSVCSASGYGNYTTTGTSVNNGTNLPIYFKLRPVTTAIKYVGVWIDFNRNGVFETIENVFTGNTTAASIAGNINIPYNVMAGETLMRVAVSNASITYGCTSFSAGETEDYKIILNVVNPLSNKFCYYVKKTAAGFNDGTSWANAFTSLATAFAYLHTGDTIKIAKGSYTAGAASTSSFVLRDSVVILGGFPDTGNPGNAQRNISDNPTIMSGEIGSVSSLADNTKLICSATNIKGFLMDGVIIEAGYCSPSGEYGPVYLNAATGTIQNCVIRNNYNAYNGSAMNVVNSKLTVLNSFVEHNQTDEGYGNPCVFAISNKSDVSLVNTVVAKNRTVALFSQAYSTVRILNSTIFKNYGFTNIHDTSSLSVQNSIFYYNGNNFTADSTEFKKDVYSAISLSNTITEVYNASAPGYFGQNPKFADTANIAGVDGKYFTADDGLKLVSPCSPAINTGNNSFVTAVTGDISGAPRVRNGIVDLGAYEVQGVIVAQQGVVYVKKNATGLNNGSSWQNAFTDLQAAFATCSDTIKVAKGVYPVSLTDPNASYSLTNHRVVMGGFPDTGSPTNADINTTMYPTQIDGIINASTKCNNIITAINNDSTCRMIGFELINSAPPIPFYPSSFATLKVFYKSSPYFENMKLNCVSNQASALISISDSSKPTFKSCAVYNGFIRQDDYDGTRAIVIANNSAPRFLKSYFGKDTVSVTATTDMGGQFLFTNSGGSIDSCYFYRSIQDVIQNVNSSTVIQNTEFAKNRGRSILNVTSTPLVVNCVFNDTATSAYNQYNGGAVANVGNTNATFIHCRFNNSFTYRNGGACTNENSTTIFKNCVFKNCTSGSNGGAIYNKTGLLTLINCIGINNGTALNVSYPQGQFLLSSEGSNASIINTTILTNSNTVHPVINCSGTVDTLKVYNSILWRHGSFAQMINIGNDIEAGNNSNPVVCDIRNSILFKQQNSLLTSSLVGIEPKLNDLTNTEGRDALVYSADDGFKPCSCSPAINAGNNSLNPEATDILALNRIFNGTIDIGAYELQTSATTNHTFYVKENAAAGGNGLSWATAYNRLQSAVLNNCADTIKIAKGTYKPASVNRDSTFNMYKYMVMLGGYPNSGNPGDAQRDVHANPTILSGDIGAPNDSTDNSYSVMQVHCPDTTVLIDGVIIEKGNFNKVSPNYPGGGGVQAIGNKLFKLNNCILRNNYATQGGGIFSFLSNMNVEKTVLTNNNAGQGGGFYLRDYYTPVNGYPWSPMVNFRNMVMAENKGSAGVVSGTAVVAGQNSTHFENVIVYKNEGNVAGFRLTDNPYVTITNCLFVANNSLNVGPGVAIAVSNPYNTLTLNTSVFNSIFAGNTVLGVMASFLNNDFNWQNGSTQQETIPYQNLAYCAVPGNQSYSGPGMIANGSVIFANAANGAGNDNTWMTGDDGLLPTTISNSIDKGGNNYVQYIPLDILDSARIRNARVDMGPYEATFSAVTQLCPPIASLTLSSASTSPTYQWQVDTGNGVFTDITDNVNYSGTNTATLTISNIPSSWYGYGYRCMLQNGSYDRVTKLQFVATWTGAVSTAWEDPGNWSCGKVPDSFTDVIINAGTVVIHSNVTIRSLSLNPGVNITVSGGNTLTVLH